MERRLGERALIRRLASAALIWVLTAGLAAAPADWRREREARYAAFTGGHPPGAVWDGIDAPEMVVVAPGRFMMGPRPTDAGLRGNETQRAEAVVSQPLAVGKYPITVGEFANFVAQTGHDAGDSCWTFEGIEGVIRKGRNWRNPGFAQTPADPVLCVSFTDVRAYADWLSGRTGQSYRLLTEVEYEYVNRAGSDAAYWWGEDIGSNRSNCDGCGSLWDNRTTSPVGSFAPNPFGLYDTTGDTWVWTSDCYATATGACAEHAIRGGAWHGGVSGLRVFSRFHHTPETHSATLGFRLARNYAAP